MSVSKKDFVATAEFLRRAKDYQQGGVSIESILDMLKTRFAEYFEVENDKFDRAKFIDACELGD